MKTKIVFAGVMGAILMSAGANAATTTLATKGYVDQQVGGVQTTVDNLQQTAVSARDVADAINEKVTQLNLGGTYELLANKVNTIVRDDPNNNKQYPTVAAVLAAMPSLTQTELEAIQKLTGDAGLITQVNALKTSVETLNGADNVEGSVANQIANAIETHKTEADNTYQAKSTADLQIGTTGGVFRNMTDAEKAALASGITKTKVAGYDATKDAVDGLMGVDGTITKLETVVGDASKGLVKDVAANKTAIATNTSAIAANAAAIDANTSAIAERILKPTAECTGPESTCVLMIRSNNVVWTPVTEPVNDPVKPVEPAGSES